MNIYLVNMKDIIWCNQCKISYNQVTGKEIVLNPPDIGDDLYDYKRKIEQINNINSNDLKNNIINIKNKILLNNNYDENNDNTKSVNQFIDKINENLKDIPNELKININIKESIDTKSMNSIIYNNNITKKYKKMSYTMYELVKVLDYSIDSLNDIFRHIDNSKCFYKGNYFYYSKPLALIINQFIGIYIPKIDHINNNNNNKDNVCLIDVIDILKVPDTIKIIKFVNTKLYNLCTSEEENDKFSQIIYALINVVGYIHKLDEIIDIIYKLNDQLNDIITYDNLSEFIIITYLKMYFMVHKSILNLSKILYILDTILNIFDKYIPNIENILSIRSNIDNELGKITKKILILIEKANTINNRKINKFITIFNTLFDSTNLNRINNRPKINNDALYIKHKYINTNISKLILERVENITNDVILIRYVKDVIKYISVTYSNNLKNKYDSSNFELLLKSRISYIIRYSDSSRKSYRFLLFKNGQLESHINKLIDIYLFSANMCQYILYQNNWNNIDDICIFISEIEYIFDNVNEIIDKINKFDNGKSKNTNNIKYLYL